VNIKKTKWILPVIVIVAAYGIASVIKSAGPTVEVVTPEPKKLTVRIVSAAPETTRLTVSSQGEVNARYMIDLVSESAGNIVAAAPAFVTGGYFAKDDVLLEIDSTDFELARIRAAALVSEAEEELEIERSEADLAAKGLFPLREAKVSSAEARLASAQAELAQAEADLARTKIRAPFAGRVLFTSVDLGQYVSKGESIGRLFSTDIAEIRLPLADDKLRYLSLPFGRQGNTSLPETPVVIRSEVGGEERRWEGYLHRMEGALDPDNRVWYAVARVDDPYGLKTADIEVPLAVGLFVEAEIQGKELKSVFRLPRIALRDQGYILVVDGNDRLRRRPVTVVKTDYDSVLISDGVEPGDKVCISPVEVFVDGLQVQTIEQSVKDKVAVN